jgi:hypothetical protein
MRQTFCAQARACRRGRSYTGKESTELGAVLPVLGDDTLPVSYLCPRHAGLVQLPLRMCWPFDATNVTPEDVIGR